MGFRDLNALVAKGLRVSKSLSEKNFRKLEPMGLMTRGFFNTGFIKEQKKWGGLAPLSTSLV